MQRRTVLATVGSTFVAGLAGCLGDDCEQPEDGVVGMTIDSYCPEELTVDAGTTVEFRNTSSHAHTVTAFQDSYPDGAEYWASGGFDSEQEAEDAWYSRNQGGKLAQGDSFEHTFEVPGNYGYYCVPHIDADMIGAVIVEES